MVITGEGRAFCFGGDVVGFQARMDDVTDYVDEIIGHLHGAIRRINEAPFPVIAGVSGTAAGAGLTAYAEKLAAGRTKAYAAARRLIRDSHHTTLPVQLHNEHATFKANTANGDFREGVAAFAEKRKPAFKGS
jgi:enoyl-CoA hydratase/carnithine racemase